MTTEELLSVAEIVERLVARFHEQSAEHEAKMIEHRAAFGVRTEADAKIIAGLREELDRVRNSLGIQAAKEASKVLGMVDGEGLRGAAERVVKERDGLRAEVAALQERLRASIARGDFAQMEISALKSQTPKQHPVKVGEWVQRTDRQYDGTPIATIKQVALVRQNEIYELTDGDFWSFMYCTPCDPPQEATHDTPAGKQAAESVIRDDWKTEPADAIKVGDLVEVFKSSSTWTSLHDIGKYGTVSEFETDVTSERIVHLREHPDDAFGLCDVRKVTT